jgi:hypothetical protein
MKNLKKSSFYPENPSLEPQGKKKMLGVVVWIGVFLALFSVNASAFSTNTFNNSLTTEDLTFTGNQNITRHLAIPSSVSILTNGFLNLSGLFIYDFIASSDKYSFGGVIRNEFNGNDSDFDTFTDVNSGSSNVEAFVIENWTWRDNFIFPVILDTRAEKNVNSHVDYRCYNFSSSSYSYWNNTYCPTSGGVCERQNLTIPTECISANRDISLNITMVQANGIVADYYESTLILRNYSQNVSLSIVNLITYNFTGNFNQTNNRTSNLASAINRFLNATYLVGSNYLIPFIFHSDTAGILQYLDMLFSNDGFTQNSQTYNNQSFELTDETLSINITYDSSYYTSSVGTIVYNNTRYLGTSGGSGNNRIFTRTLTTPRVEMDTNVSFYWEIALTNSSGTSLFNSTVNNQTVKNLSLDDCSVNTILLINYTLKDETVRNILSSPTVNSSTELTLTLSPFSQTGENLNISFNKTNTNPTRVCIGASLFNTTNYRLDSTIKYSSTNRVTEYHNLQNRSVSNSSVPILIDLYDLLSTESQEFLITVKDVNFIPIKDAVIEINRQYLDIGQFLLVEAPKTDADGRTIGHFVLNDIIYTIIIKKNGVVLATFNNVRAFCSDISTGNCRLNLNVAGSTTLPSSFTTIEGITYSINYNDVSRIFTLVFNVNDGTNKNVSLSIKKYDQYLNQTFCFNSLTSSSGTILCTVPASAGNGTALVEIFSNGKLAGTTLITLKFISSIRDMTKYIIAFVLVLTLPLIAISSPVIMMILFFTGLILSGLFGLIEWGGFYGGISAFIWFLIAGFIIMIALMARRNR